jgi:glycine/D-amino acid oxidase-like deaminating enzyme
MPGEVGPVPIEASCYWLARNPSEPGPPLEGDRDADIVIVGGGLTGLWTALHLRALDPGLGIAILEQARMAYGASGRNAGMLAEGIDHSHDLAIAHFGRGEALRLVGLGRENVAEMRRYLDEHAIDCDLEATGLLQVALLPRHLKSLEAILEGARSLGIGGYRLLERDEVRAEVHCDRYQGGLFNPHAAILDPVRLVGGLRREAERQGVAIWEQTPVAGVEPDGAGVRIVAASGRMRARRAVLATNAYTHHLLPAVRARFIPFYDYIVVSEPLSGPQREALGWRNRQGVTDVRSFFKYYRLTADGRVLWGTSEAQYYGGNRVHPSCDHSPRLYAALKNSFFRHFPALEGLEFPYAWGGPIAATTRFTPFFGRALGDRMLYGLGYTGHGLGSTHLAGKLLAHMALDRETPLLDLKIARAKPFPYPPEPFRAWAVVAVSRALRRVDAGERPGLLLRLLDAMGLGLSS